MRLSQNHEMLVYTEILDALSELHQMRTRHSSHTQLLNNLASPSVDDLFALYKVIHCEPEKAVESLEEFAQSGRGSEIRRFARQVASWERNQAGNAKVDR